MKFPKEARLLKRGEFLRMGKGQRRVGSLLCVDCRPAGKARLGITASSRYGDAHERNRFKRLVREAFRTNQHLLPKFELNVTPRQHAKGATYGQIRDELLKIIK